MIKKSIMITILTWLFFLFPLALLSEAESIYLHVSWPESLLVVDGYIDYTTVSWSDTHHTSSFSGNLQAHETGKARRICWEQLAKSLKNLLDWRPRWPFLGGPPTLTYLTGGYFTGECNIAGPCGQFFSTFTSTPDTFSLVFSCTVPDSVIPGTSGSCYASGLTWQSQPGVAEESAVLVERIEPDLVCTSLVAMTVYYDPTIQLEAQQRTTVWDTLVFTSDTTFTVSGVATVQLVRAPIPTLTEWGLIIFGVVLLGFITWVFLRRRKAVISLR
jgi:hypothetical protein